MNESPGLHPFSSNACSSATLQPGSPERWAPRRIFVCAFALIGLLPVGCGNQPVPSSPAQNSRASNAAEDDSERQEQPAPRAATAGKSNSKKKSLPGGHIGEIPRDAWPEVFFQEPLTVLAEGGAASAPAQEKPSGDKSPGKATSEPTVARDVPRGASDPGKSAPSAGEDDWGALISGEELANEAKSIKASLTAKLQAVSKYSGNYKEVRVDGATLAVLAGIAAEHPEPPGWKNNAGPIRDVAAEMVREAQANGEKFYKPTRAAFDKLDTLLSGSKPPGIEASGAKVPFSETARRGHLMLRLDRAFNFMKLQINTEVLFKKEKSKVGHEGAIVSALAKVITTPGYDDSDLDEYRKFARDMQESGIAIVEAARDGDYQAFSAAVDRCSKACTGCHMEYRTN